MKWLKEIIFKIFFWIGKILGTYSFSLGNGFVEEIDSSEVLVVTYDELNENIVVIFRDSQKANKIFPANVHNLSLVNNIIQGYSKNLASKKYN